MYTRDPYGGERVIRFGSGGPIPIDLWVLIGIVFFTYSLQFFEGSQMLPELLRLTPLVWQRGLVWQLATYPFAGIGAPGAPSIWILISLLILFWFARDVFGLLGRRRFWELVLAASVGAGVMAVLVDLLLRLAMGGPVAVPFGMMQGQRMLIVIMIAAFATLRRDATILLFFVLPIQAKYFLALEILFAFIYFLGNKDFAGFVGICVAVGITYGLLTGTRVRSVLREARLRVERWMIQLKLARLRRRRGFRVVRGKGDNGGSDGPSNPDRWVH